MYNELILKYLGILVYVNYTHLLLWNEPTIVLLLTAVTIVPAATFTWKMVVLMIDNM